MKKFISLYILLLFSSAGLFAQSIYDVRNAIDFFEFNRMQRGEQKKSLSESDIEGSPYMNDEFINGSIYTVSKTQYTDVPLRYNIYNDDIEFETPQNDVYALGAPEMIEKVVFGDYTMEYIPFEFAKKIKKGFFKLMLSGKVSLYARPEIQFIEAKEPAPYKEAEPARFNPKEDRYYIRIGMEAAQLCGNKKDAIAILSDHQKEVESFIKKEKINVKKLEELKSLLEYYNSL